MHATGRPGRDMPSRVHIRREPPVGSRRAPTSRGTRRRRARRGPCLRSGTSRGTGDSSGWPEGLRTCRRSPAGLGGACVSGRPTLAASDPSTRYRQGTATPGWRGRPARAEWGPKGDSKPGFSDRRSARSPISGRMGPVQVVFREMQGSQVGETGELRRDRAGQAVLVEAQVPQAGQVAEFRRGWDPSGRCSRVPGLAGWRGCRVPAGWGRSGGGCRRSS